MPQHHTSMRGPASAVAALLLLLLSVGVDVAWAGRLVPVPQRMLAGSYNGITPNGFSGNQLLRNAVTLNALATIAIAQDSLDSSTTTALTNMTQDSESGQSARMLLKYLVRCAFDPSQSISVNYTKTDNNGNAASVTETYTGALGLAPDWATGPLNDMSSQQWVTACLIAHVNYYGTSVQISVRGEPDVLKKATIGTELATYKSEEGAFWGNMFNDTPYLYACYNAANVEYARSLFRECAAGHVMPDGSVGTCGPIQIVGPCEQVCSHTKGKGQYCSACQVGDDGPVSDAVITVYLP